MHIEVELAFEVMRAKLAEMCFIPDDNVGSTYVVKTSVAGKECVNYRWYVFHILKKEFSLKTLSARTSSGGPFVDVQEKLQEVGVSA